MRRVILSFIVCFVSFLSASIVYAHPPSDIKVAFDQAKHILTAVIVHNTSNPSKHYISKVDIGLNGKEIISQDISWQDNGVEQTVSYLIPDVNVGDVLSVEGYCSISGKLKREIAVKAN